MKKTIKIISLLLAIVLSATLLSGCNKRKEGYPPVWTSDDRVVMKLGEYNVAYDFYRYLFMNTIKHFDNGDKEYWNIAGNDVNKVKDYVLESLKQTYSMFVLADKYDITLSEADLLDIETTIKQEKSGYSNEEFKSALEKEYLTEELYEFLIKVQYLEYIVYSHITSDSSGILKIDDKTLEKEIEENFARATHILFTYENEEQRQSQKELAEQVLEKLKNGEDFETLKEEYSDDTDLKGNKDGYYFTHGEFNNMFEYSAFELKEGEISDIITTDVGFHIVKRLPLEKEYISKNFEQLRKQCMTSKYYEMIKEASGELNAEYTKEFKNIKLDTFNKG